MFFNTEEKIGEKGERAAAKYLSRKGCKILDRNWFNRKGKRVGEIDIIARKDNEIIFVEVKTREVSDDSGILPEEQITQSKLQKIQRSAECYIKEHDLWDCGWRVDAVSVYVKNGKVDHIEHIKHVFF